MKPGSGRSFLSKCSEIPGTICSAGSGEICEGTEISTSDGLCCTGICVNKGSPTGRRWIGYLIAGIVILIILLIFVKYKNTGSKTKGKPEQDDRFNPNKDISKNIKDFNARSLNLP